MFNVNIDKGDFYRLWELIKQAPEVADEETEKWFDSKGIDLFKENIIKRINHSGRDKSNYTQNPRTHAINSEPFTHDKVKDGVKIKSRGGSANTGLNQFGYLVFPDEGRGYTNPLAQNFTITGIDETLPVMVKDLTENISKRLEL